MCKALLGELDFSKGYTHFWLSLYVTLYACRCTHMYASICRCIHCTHGACSTLLRRISVVPLRSTGPRSLICSPDKLYRWSAAKIMHFFAGAHRRDEFSVTDLYDWRSRYERDLRPPVSGCYVIELRSLNRGFSCICTGNEKAERKKVVVGKISEVNWSVSVRFHWSCSIGRQENDRLKMQLAGSIILIIALHDIICRCTPLQTLEANSSDRRKFDVSIKRTRK